MRRVRNGFWIALLWVVVGSVVVMGIADMTYRPYGWPCKQCMEGKKHEHPVNPAEYFPMWR